MPLSTLGSATSRAFGFKGLSAFTNWFGLFSGSTSTSAPLSIDSSSVLYTGMDDAGGAIKVSNTGEIAYQKSISGISNAYANAVDSSGNLYTLTLSGSLYKYNSAGVLQWQKTFSSVDSTTALTVDSSGNVYVCGTIYTGVYFRGFIAKVTSAGAITWQRYLTQTTTTNDGISGNAVTVDSSGNVYVAGNNTASSGTVFTAVVAKYNTSGTIQWQRKLTDSSSSRLPRVGGMAVDSSANIYIGLSDDVQNTGSHLVKYNTSGAIQWQRKIVTGSNSYSLARCFIYNNTDIYVAGFTNASIAKYNTSGTIQWQREIANVGLLRGLAADAESFYVTTTDRMLIKLPNDGSRTGTYGSYIYQNGARTEQAGTLTDAAGSFTDAAGSLTIANASGTESTTSKTLTLTGVS